MDGMEKITGASENVNGGNPLGEDDDKVGVMK